MSNYTSHDMDPTDKCESKAYFTATQALMLTLQKTTGKHTHEIMSDLVALYEQMLVDYEIDINKKSTLMSYIAGFGWGNSNTVNKKRTILFPGSNVYVSCRITLDYYLDDYDEFEFTPYRCYNNKKESECIKCDANTIVVKVSFFMPQRKLTFTQEQLQEMILEGAIFDVSEDIEELKIKDSPTPQEKRDRRAARKKLKQQDKTKTESNKR